MNEIELLELRISEAGSVTKLARAIGENQNTISNWLKRKRVPSGWAKYFEAGHPKFRKAKATSK